jgi:hypothetical protein
VLQRFTGMHTPAEKIYRSIERAAPLPLQRRVQTHESMRASAMSRLRESAAPLPRVLNLAAITRRQGTELNRRREPFDLPALRRADAEQASSSRLPLQSVLATAFAAPLTVAPITRAFAPVALAGRLHRDLAQSRGAEPRAKMNHVEFFSSAPKLIWRQVVSAKMNDSHESVSQAQRIAVDEAMPTAARTRTTGVTQSAPEPVPHKPARLSDLEPSFVDRLTDDVIRRVERRARIERERRGL